MKFFSYVFFILLFVSCSAKNAGQIDLSAKSDSGSETMDVSVDKTTLKFGMSIDHYEEISAGATGWGSFNFLQSDGGIVFISPFTAQVYIKESNSPLKRLTNLNLKRMYAEVVQLNDHQYLILSGSDYSWNLYDQVELYDVSANDGLGASTNLQPLITPRYLFSAVVLPNGKVLISGGRSQTNFTLDSVELYDPSGEGSSVALTSLSFGIESHKSFLMSNGKVVLMNGYQTAYIYDPSGGGSSYKFDISVMPQYRYYGWNAIKVSGDKILNFSGPNGSNEPMPDVDLFDPFANGGLGQTTSLTDLPKGISYSDAVQLSNGKIIMVEGAWNTYDNLSVFEYDLTGNSGAGSVRELTNHLYPRDSGNLKIFKRSDDKVIITGGVSAIEVYDPSLKGIGGSVTKPKKIGQDYSASSVLKDGSLLITGGYSDLRSNKIVEKFIVNDENPKGVFVRLNDLNFSHVGHLAIVLGDGRVVIFGGEDDEGNPSTKVEIYNPEGNGGKGESKNLTDMQYSRAYFSGHLLDNGKIILIGGSSGENWDNIANVELYDPSGEGSSVELAPLNTGRGWFHTSTLLPDGKILVAGGNDFDWSNILSSVELYDPKDGGSSTNLTSLLSARNEHQAFLLNDGKVVFVNGYGDEPLTSVEVYNPNEGGSSEIIADISLGKNGSTSMILPDGNLFVTGGYTYDENWNQIFSKNYEIVDLKSGNVELVEDDKLNFSHASIDLLANGQLLIHSGSSGLGGYNLNWSILDFAESAKIDVVSDSKVSFEFISGAGIVTDHGYFVPGSIGETKIKVFDENGNVKELTFTVNE